MRLSREIKVLVALLAVSIILSGVNLYYAINLMNKVTQLSMGEQVGTIAIGVMAPFTGHEARVGQQYHDAAILAFEDFNYTLLGKKIKPVWVDTRSLPEEGVRAFESAVLRDGIVACAGGWHSTVAVAVMDTAAKYKIPVLNIGAGTELQVEKYQSDPEKYKYWFKTWPSPPGLAYGYFEAVKSIIDKGIWTPRNNKMGIIVEETEWGRSYADAMESANENGEYGWDIVTRETVKKGETDLYPYINKLIENDVCLVFSTFSSEEPRISLVKQARELGLNALCIQDGLGWVTEWYDLTGEASNGWLDMALKWATPEAKAFRDKFVARFGYEPSPIVVGQVYDNVKMLLTCIEKAGSTDPDAIIEAILSTEYKGIMHTYKYDPQTHAAVVGEGYVMFPVVEYWNGESVIIWPENIAEGEYTPPPWLG